MASTEVNCGSRFTIADSKHTIIMNHRYTKQQITLVQHAILIKSEIRM